METKAPDPSTSVDTTSHDLSAPDALAELVKLGTSLLGRDPALLNAALRAATAAAGRCEFTDAEIKIASQAFVEDCLALWNAGCVNVLFYAVCCGTLESGWWFNNGPDDDDVTAETIAGGARLHIGALLARERGRYRHTTDLRAILIDRDEDKVAACGPDFNGRIGDHDLESLLEAATDLAYAETRAEKAAALCELVNAKHETALRFFIHDDDAVGFIAWAARVMLPSTPQPGAFKVHDRVRTKGRRGAGTVLYADADRAVVRWGKALAEHRVSDLAVIGGAA
jgi:hypothetical protein